MVNVALRDGSTLQVRPVSAQDTEAIAQFLQSLSTKSVGFRFFGALNLDWVTRWSVDVDYADRYALVAVAGPQEAIVAHGAYVRVDHRRAEVAFLVADAWQGRGIATIMLAHLAAVAEEHAISEFVAEVLPHNHRMIDVFRESGFPITTRPGEDVIDIELPTSLSAQARERFEAREQIAAIAAIGSFLRPRSVAVIGASRRRRTIGAELLRKLRGGGFTGTVYAVNARAHTVQGQRSYVSVATLPQTPDLAVVAVPANQVLAVASQCAERGVRALLVISAGFAEIGPEGLERQQELLALCRASGMRMIGPNCLGVANTAPDIRLDATFAPSAPPPGRIGLLSQSGGLGIAVIQAAGRLGVGLSSFVSVGNKADISGNDLLQYWEKDPDTDVLLLYLESFGNPRRFARIARRIGSRKPIVAVKSGRSPAGARATASHTGALIGASDITVDALFSQAGVIRTDTMHELFDVAALLDSQPIPAGGRVVILTNAGGPGIMCADAAQAAGLDVVELPARVQEQLGDFLASEASLANPIDMIASASAEQYRHAIELLGDAGVCDAVIAIFVPPLVTDARDVARELRRASARTRSLTVASVFMTGDRAPAALIGERVRVPAFQFPEEAARALSHVVRYAQWRARPHGEVRRPARLRFAQATALIASALQTDTQWLTPSQVTEVLACYGLPLVSSAVVRSAQRAVETAAAFAGPIALKAVAEGLVHKSDVGGVCLGLSGPEEILRAAGEIRRSVTAAGYRLDGLLVQQMAPAGVELLAGVIQDESFGAVIACGAGGTAAELSADVAVRITPLTDLDAAEMLRSLRVFALLDGYRGQPRCDIAAVEEILICLNALVEDHPQIVELDANPIVVGPTGALILDARIRVHRAAPRRPIPSLDR